MSELVVGKIASYTYKEYNSYACPSLVSIEYDNIDVSDCLTMASIMYKIRKEHEGTNNSDYKIRHGDFVVLSIMEINQ